MNAPPSTLLLPSVDHEVCVGCGLCELACITENRPFVFCQGSMYWEKQDLIM